MSAYVPPGMGWIPDLPDPRDFNYRHQSVLPLLAKLPPSSEEVPEEVDLRGGDEGECFLTETDCQGPLNSSAAFAVLSLVEYFERRVHGRTFEGSRHFLYKVARNLRNKRCQVAGDTGVDLRNTFRALIQFGTPAEEHWPVSIEAFDNEPDSFVYGLARPMSDLRYFRLSGSYGCVDNVVRWETLTSFLAAGFPVVFGFPVPSSLTVESCVPHRPQLDGIRGGQCALAIGYRCNHFGPGHHSLLIRNSWGRQWGDHGNGWLPIGYIRNRLARDFWTLISENWLDAAELKRPHILG